MVRHMYDSIDPTIIPLDAGIIAYFPHEGPADLKYDGDALIVRVDNYGDGAADCHVLDVESGAANVTTAIGWVQEWHALHPNGMDAVNGWVRKPVLYASLSGRLALYSACHGMDYDMWVAQWDGDDTPVNGCFAKQYRGQIGGGVGYNLSAVYDDTWGVKPVLTEPIDVESASQQ